MVAVFRRVDVAEQSVNRAEERRVSVGEWEQNARDVKTMFVVRKPAPMCAQRVIQIKAHGKRSIIVTCRVGGDVFMMVT